MQVYDKVIETTRELLKPFPVKELNRDHAKPWNLLKENVSAAVPLHHRRSDATDTDRNPE